MATLETSQPLSIESFSYSWLINLKPSLESLSESFRAALDSSDSSSFIEMDPNTSSSRRFMKLETDFDFNLPFSDQSTAAMVHADELFRNGLLIPLVDSPSRTRAYSEDGSSQCASPFSDVQKRAGSSDQKFRCSSIRRCRSLLSRKNFDKYLYFLCPLLEKLRCCGLKSRGRRRRRGADNRICPLRSTRVCSPQGSPRTSLCSSPGDWRRSCDSESSIHEAVLHCKRSFGM